MLPLGRLQKLEGKIATQLHHIKPLLQKWIFKYKERVEKIMEAEMEHKVQAVLSDSMFFSLEFLRGHPRY